MTSQHEMEAQAEFHAHEMAVDTAGDRAWAKWLDEVVAHCRAMGHAVNDAMDGDGATEGYSLDQCYDWYRAGWLPLTAAQWAAAGIMDAGQ